MAKSYHYQKGRWNYKPITVSAVNRKDGVSPPGIACSLDSINRTDGERYISPKDKMNKYVKDKERIDQITEIIANQQPVKEWVVIYWLAVAVGHLLEWVVRHEKMS